MRKIENPVPMYARNVGLEKNVEIPELNKEIGFDLMASDWVAPYGKGATADFVFFFERNSLDPKEYISKLRIAFTEKNDGIIKIKQNLDQGSKFKFLRFAPKTGYLADLVQFSEKKSGQWFNDSFNSNDNYVFRVRSEVGASGKIGNALYGKIIGPIQFFPARSKKSTILQFKYYLNPDGTRNLEFDPKQNLFGKLPTLERVKEP